MILMVLMLLISLILLMWLMLLMKAVKYFKRGPVQPRSPCELPPADHPHTPGSHQQSCCPLSNFQKLNFVTHIGRLFHLKNMRSPSTTQPFTRKELKELDFRVSDRELEDLWELKDHGELKELRELKELCPQSVFVLKRLIKPNRIYIFGKLFHQKICEKLVLQNTFTSHAVGILNLAGNWDAYNVKLLNLPLFLPIE